MVKLIISFVCRSKTSHPAGWPILGIIFLPLTTLAYVFLWNTGGRGVTGWEWIFAILAAFADLASYGGGAYGRRRAAY